MIASFINAKYYSGTISSSDMPGTKRTTIRTRNKLGMKLKPLMGLMLFVAIKPASLTLSIK